MYLCEEKIRIASQGIGHFSLRMSATKALLYGSLWVKIHRAERLPNTDR